MLQFPEKFRATTPQFSAQPGQGGIFKIPLKDGAVAVVIATNGFGWEHVSIVVHAHNATHTPTWDQMCIVKDAFWHPEDCVVQYHPPKSDYINNHPNCLHLWRPTGCEVPRPPSLLVGLKTKQQPG